MTPPSPPALLVALRCIAVSVPCAVSAQDAGAAAEEAASGNSAAEYEERAIPRAASGESGVSIPSNGGAVADAPTADIVLDAVPENASKRVGLLWPDVFEFAPARGETHVFRIAVEKHAAIDLDVLGPDGDLVRTLLAVRSLEPGTHDIVWDGRDDEGELVPDEVYTPRFRANVDDTSTLDDPRRYSGGEILPNIEWRRRGGTELSYVLPEPARVLIRTGVEDGPMLRELSHWEPVDAGRVVVRWDGYDADRVDRFAEREDVWTVVMAYRLPEFAVIASGNGTIDYLDYRKRRGWPRIEPDLSDVRLERRGERLSRDHFLPRGYLPRVSLSFAGPVEPSRLGPPVVGDAVLFRIDVPDEDRWILDSTFYETGFYVDYRFQSEEEQGFVPLVWEYDARDLPAGRHVATVQLFGFGGFITSDTVEFLVEP